MKKVVVVREFVKHSMAAREFVKCLVPEQSVAERETMKQPVIVDGMALLQAMKRMRGTVLFVAVGEIVKQLVVVREFVVQSFAVKIE